MKSFRLVEMSSEACAFRKMLEFSDNLGGNGYKYICTLSHSKIEECETCNHYICKQRSTPELSILQHISSTIFYSELLFRLQRGVISPQEFSEKISQNIVYYFLHEIKGI